MTETDTHEHESEQEIDAVEEAAEELDDEESDEDGQVFEGQIVEIHEVAEEEPLRALAIRHVLERQLVASHELSEQLVGAATDVSLAIVHAPAAVVDEIRGGATLPAAFTKTGTSVREVVGTAGDRVRTAVGEYVGGRAVLPNAVIVGAADVAESVVRAQSAVTASAIGAAFSIATVATRGGDVRESFEEERREVGSSVGTAREGIATSVRQARQHIGSALDTE